MALQRHANGGKRKNAGDLTPALAKSIIAAVRKTPLSLKSAAYACGFVVQDLRYMIKRGSLPGADPLWEDTSRRVRELIAAAEARNFARLDSAAENMSVPAMVEVQRQVEKDTWQIDPAQEDAPIVYMAMFSRPLELPADILEALIANGWKHPALVADIQHAQVDLSEAQPRCIPELLPHTACDAHWDDPDQT